MAYTALRVVERGVLFYETQAERFERTGGKEARRAFEGFAASAAPGSWIVRFDAGRGLSAEAGPGSRLFDGMPVRLLPSPLGGEGGFRDKAEPPGPYGPLRAEGLCTLLTSPQGEEIWESCRAAVLAWDGKGLVCPPDDRPRVWSTAEAFLRRRLPVRQAAIPGDCDAILAVNAVKGACFLEASRSRGFPAHAGAELAEAIAASARRP